LTTVCMFVSHSNYDSALFQLSWKAFHFVSVNRHTDPVRVDSFTCAVEQ